MIPFALNMASLFELFVARWLGNNLPPGITLKAQHLARLDNSGQLSFKIDLVLFDASQHAYAVLDTKYKRDAVPSEDDVQQVVVILRVRLKEDIDYDSLGSLE